MAKLTKKQIACIHSAINDIERTRKFIEDSETIVGRIRPFPTNKTDFMLPDGRVACLINKQYGSNLNGYEFALRTLNSLLMQNKIIEDDECKD